MATSYASPAPKPDQAVRYNSVARALHWTIALLVLFNLFTGLFGESLEKVWVSMPLHKATGLLILVLSLARLGWRLTSHVPPFAADMQPVMRLIARVTHSAFYVLMIAMPVTGWIFSSAGKWPLSVYGLFDWPKLAVTKDMPIVGAAATAHEILGYGFAGLVVLHVGAALYHNFVLKDATLRRMV
jgi:cytochrome b561